MKPLALFVKQSRILCSIALFSIFVIAAQAQAPPGGGTYLMLDEFGKTAHVAANHETMDFPAANVWETWTSSAGSGTDVIYSGSGTATLQMKDTYQSYLDTRNGGSYALSNTHDYAFIVVFKMGPSGGMSAGFDANSTYLRGFKIFKNKIYYSNNNDTPQTTDTAVAKNVQIGTYVTSETTALLMWIDKATQKVKIYKQTGNSIQKASNSSAWVDITPADPNNVLNFATSYSARQVGIFTLAAPGGAAASLANDRFTLDMVTVIQDPGAPQAPRSGVAIQEDDFDNRGPADLDQNGTGNNNGTKGLVWRHNDGLVGANDNHLDGVTTLQMPMNGGWSQYIDTGIAGGGGGITGKDIALVAVFTMPATGDECIGYAKDASWDNGASPQNQRLIKIKSGVINVTHDHLPTGTDQSTGQSIVPAVQQSVQIRSRASDGKIRVYYANGPVKDAILGPWIDITPATDAQSFQTMNYQQALFGVNNSAAGAAGSHFNLDYIGLIDVTTAVPVELNSFSAE